MVQNIPLMYVEQTCSSWVGILGSINSIIRLEWVIIRGVSRNFSREGFWNFFVLTGKFRGGFGIFFKKNPSKLKKILQKGGVLTPKPLPKYAPGRNRDWGLNLHLRTTKKMFQYLLSERKINWKQFRQTFYSIKSIFLLFIEKGLELPMEFFLSREFNEFFITVCCWCLRLL